MKIQILTIALILLSISPVLALHLDTIKEEKTPGNGSIAYYQSKSNLIVYGFGLQEGNYQLIYKDKSIKCLKKVNPKISLIQGNYKYFTYFEVKVPLKKNYNKNNILLVKQEKVDCKKGVLK